MREVTFDEIVQAVAETYEIAGFRILGRARLHRIVEARQLVILIARRRTTMSYPEIGQLIGGRNHSTIMHGEDRILCRLCSEPALRERLADSERLLGVAGADLRGSMSTRGPGRHFEAIEAELFARGAA